MTADRRRFPKVLADEIGYALSRIRNIKLENELTDEQFSEFLEAYRRNKQRRMVNMISTQGGSIISKGAQTIPAGSVPPVEGVEPFPPKFLNDFDVIDMAFQRMHKYRNGGAGDYVASAVVSEIQRLNAKKPREQTHQYDQIIAYMKRRGYESSDQKGSVVGDAEEFFKTSKSTIYRALKWSRSPKK